MTRQRTLNLLFALSLSTLGLGTVGCANGQSPTEPSPALETMDSAVVADSSVASATVEDKRHGGDDNGADDNRGRGRGSDDRSGDDRGRGRGRGGRGNDDNGGNNNGGNNTTNPRVGREFEGRVTAVNGSTVVLSGGLRVTVNGSTQWSNRGDLFNLRQVSASVSSGDFTRVEGRGTRQNDGSILAATIKAEVDN